MNQAFGKREDQGPRRSPPQEVGGEAIQTDNTRNDTHGGQAVEIEEMQQIFPDGMEKLLAMFDGGYISQRRNCQEE